MKNTEYRRLARELKEQCGIHYPADLAYVGFWDGLHHMQRQNPVYCKDRDGNTTNSMSHYLYSDIAFDDEDATNGNLLYFVQNGLTRSERVTE